MIGVPTRIDVTSGGSGRGDPLTVVVQKCAGVGDIDDLDIARSGGPITPAQIDWTKRRSRRWSVPTPGVTAGGYTN